MMAPFFSEMEASMQPLRACLAGWSLALLVPTAALAAETKGDMKGEVKAAYAAWDAAFNQHDAKALAANYATNARVLPPTHEAANGPAEIEKFFGGVIGSGVSNHRLELLDSGSSGQLVWAAARWSAEAKGTDGSVKPVGGFATHVFERSGNRLKLKLHTFN
jgi:ketosteroid isomerase-like protein